MDSQKDTIENLDSASCYAIVHGEKPFGASHWTGTVNGDPAIVLSWYGGAAIWIFDGEWRKDVFPSLAKCFEHYGIQYS